MCSIPPFVEEWVEVSCIVCQSLVDGAAGACGCCLRRATCALTVTTPGYQQPEVRHNSLRLDRPGQIFGCLCMSVT